MSKKIKKSTKQILAFILTSTMLVFVFFQITTPTAQAGWWDDSYEYRQPITIGNSGAADAYKKVKLDIDTRSGAGQVMETKAQSDCDDIRFTDANGMQLKYYLDSAGGACNTSSTDFYVLMPTIPTTSSTIYMYYGNPIASAGTQAAQFTESTFSPTSGPTQGTEAQTPTPISYWKLDEGVGGDTYDSGYTEANQLAITGATWKSPDYCISGFCLGFDGSGDHASKSYSADTELNPGTGGFTVSGWFKHTSTISGTDTLVSRASGTLGSEVGYKIYMNSSGFLCFGIDASAGSFPNDDACSSVSYADSKWHKFMAIKNSTTSIVLYVDGYAVDTQTGITSSSISGSSPSFRLGIDSDGSSNGWDGYIDEVKYYAFALTASKIPSESASKSNAKPVSANLSQNTPYAALSTGLTGYWKMDENTGTSVTDSSGNGGTLTLNSGATFAAGKFGYASTYDATNDNGSIADNDNLNDFTASQDFTVAFWLLDGGSNASQDAIVEKWAGSGGYPYAFRYSSGGYIDFSRYDGTNNPTTTNVTKVINDSTWHHVVGVKSSNTLYLYIDGALIGTTTDTTSGTTTNASSVYLASRGGSGQYWGGRIDDLRIYNRALNKFDASQLYDWGASPTAYWNLEENKGTTIYDISTNGRTTTLNNSPAWATGKYGSALSFNGSTQNISVGSPINIGAYTGFTIMTWVRTTSNLATAMNMYAEANAGQTNYAGLNIDTASTDFVYGFISDGSATDFSVGSNAVNINDGNWHHVAFIQENKSLRRLYIDGVLRATNTNTLGTVNNNSTSTIASWVDASDKFVGSLDEIKIYTYGRNAKQVLEDMNAGHPVVGTPVGSYAGYWTFDESTGTTAYDKSPNSNNLTLSTASWTLNGKYGGAWNGTGANPYVSRTDDDDFDFGSTVDFTLSLWAKSDSASNPAGSEFLIDKQVATNNPGYRLYFNTSGQLVCDIDDDTSSYPEDSATTTNDYYDATWHHVVCIRDNSQDKLNVYVDGNLSGQDTDLSATGDLSNADTLTIGAQDTSSGGSDDFAGDIDELKIYRLAFSAADVLTEFNHAAATSLGSTSTDSSGGANNSQERALCVPGDGASCPATAAWWKMDENSGSTIADSSGNGNTSSAFTNDVGWRTGKFGSSTTFDGTNDVIQITEASSTDIGGTTDNYSVSAWIKTTTNYGANAGIVAKNDGSGAYPYYLILNSSEQACFQISDGTNSPAACGSTALNDGKWHHLVGVRSATDDLLYMYVDGAYITSSTDTTTATTVNNDNLSIGNSGTSYQGDDFNGQIDQVMIHSGALTLRQVAWLYNRSEPYSSYSLDECQGNISHNTAKDSNGDAPGRDGTINLQASGMTTLGTCTTSSTAWGNGATGKFNASLDFDGTDDYIGVASPSLPTRAFTYSLWFKPDSFPSTSTLIMVSDGSGGNEFKVDLVNSDGSVRLAMDSGGGSASLTTFTQKAVLSSWNHLVITRNTSGTTLMYLNGRLDPTTVSNSVVLSFSTCYLLIGVDADTTSTASCADNLGEYFDGQIDEVKIYNVHLTQAQVQVLYNQNAAVRFGPSSEQP